MIQYQILQIYIIRIIWQTVRRITNEILGVKGLRVLGWSPGHFNTLCLILQTLTPVCIFSILFPIHFQVLTRRICLTIESFFGCGHFLYPCDLFLWFRGDIVGRIQMLIIIRSQTVKLRENSVESFAMHRLIDWQNKKGQGQILWPKKS